MISLKNQAAVAGIGCTEFSKNSGRSELALASEALCAAAEDAGLPVSEIDGLVSYTLDPTDEIELARSDDHLTRLRTLMVELTKANAYDFVILDTPPSLGVLMTASLASADEVIIPLQCEWFGLEGLAKIVHVIQQIRESDAAPLLKVEGILMTMFDGRTNLSRQVVEEVSNYFPEQLYKSVIPRTIRIGEAPSHGKTIFEHEPNGIGSLAYRAAAEEFLKRHGIRKKRPRKASKR